MSVSADYQVLHVPASALPDVNCSCLLFPIGPEARQKYKRSDLRAPGYESASPSLTLHRALREKGNHVSSPIP